MGSIVMDIGTWTFAPWRSTVYSKKLPHANGQAWACRQVNSIGIDGTCHRAPSVADFASWRAALPAGFVFAVEAAQHTLASWRCCASLLSPVGPAQPRECLIYCISDDNVRAPGSARGLLQRAR